jgi:hypothetical protein
MGDMKTRSILGGLHLETTEFQPPRDLLEGEFGRIQG